MSMESHYYVIVGYDLTGCETDKFDKWKWTDEGEDYINNKCKGKIQFFDDPMSGSYLFFGYVLADGDEYGFLREDKNLGDNILLLTLGAVMLMEWIKRDLI